MPPSGEEEAEGTVVVAVNEERTPPVRRFRMPQECIDWILSQKRHVLEEDPDEYYARMMSDPDRHEVYTPEFLHQERHLMRNMAELYRRSGDRLEAFQRWVRRELGTKGCVELDDEYLERRIRYCDGHKKLYDAMTKIWNWKDPCILSGDAVGA